LITSNCFEKFIAHRLKIGADIKRKIMPEYNVNQGESIASIAHQQGIFWETIWNHPHNAQLKERRGNPNILYPGDVVFIPEKEEKQESCATEQRHHFRKKGNTIRLQLRILAEPEEEEPQQRGASSPGGSDRTTGQGTAANPQSQADRPRANAPYILEMDGNLSRGTTDDNGVVDCRIPANARTGRLTVDPGTPKELVLPLQIGHLNPLSELSGVKQRLASLGFSCGDLTDEPSPQLEAALRSFQEKYGLPVTGQLDEQTRNNLREKYLS
jgi:hypothetical protein